MIRSSPSLDSFKDHCSPFILEVIKDAVLLVDKEKFLFANRAFEEMFDFPWCLIEPQTGTTILLASERARFFQLVARLIDGEAVFNEALVDCMNNYTGPFLSKVIFRPYIDVFDNNKKKCVCIFSDPLFYKKLLDKTSMLIGILEYIPEESDCAIFRANKAAYELLKEGTVGSSSDSDTSQHSSDDSSPRANQQQELELEHSPKMMSISQTLLPVRYLDGKRLCRDLEFQIKVEDKNFFETCRRPDMPHVTRFQVNVSQQAHHIESPNPKRGQRQIVLQSTITFIGHSLNNRSMFTIVGEDITHTLELESDLKDSKLLLLQQNTFVAKMIHELRTPLSGLLGMAGLLRSTALTTEQSDFLKTLEVCGDSLFSLIGNILDLSNLERNKLTLALQPFDVVDCIEEALDMVSQQACQKGIDLFYEILPHPLSQRVIGDDMRVRQILLVLLSNAMKFTGGKPNTRIVVRATLKQQAQSDDLVVHFSVQDSGIGISPKDQLNLFKVFSQANTTVSQTYGGSGLGLAVAKSLVELMGGKIWVESGGDGQGSTFHFTISTNMRIAQQQQVSNDMQEELHQKRVIEVQRSFAGKTALILLKEQQFAHNFHGRLTALGLTPCYDIPSGSKAPDVILADVHLLRSDSYSAQVPWIGIGWSRTPGFVSEFLRKPVRSKLLIDALRRSFHAPPLEETMLVIQEHAVAKHRGPASPLAYCRILLVDDSVINRKIARHMLEQLGYQASGILTASNGVEAVALMAQQVFDIIVMDWEMPIMNGEEATRKIRQRWALQPDRPYIIGATANATEQARVKCFACGMNAFLSKPLRFDTLAEAFSVAVSTLLP